MNISSGEETRYILELMQNADDAQFLAEENSERALEGKLTFVVSNTALYCANTGYPISIDGLKALCDSFLSTKTRGKPTIGFKGIGYKSILGITEAPSIFWHDGCVSFSKEGSWKIFKEIVPYIEEEQIPILRYPIQAALDTELTEDPILKELWDNHTSVFRFPFGNGVKAKDVWHRLQEIMPSTLLFTHHLSKVEVKNRTTDTHYNGFSFEIGRKNIDEIEQTSITVDGIESSWIVIREVYDVTEHERSSFRTLCHSERSDSNSTSALSK